MLHPTLPVTGNKHTLGIGWTGSKRNRSLLIRNALMHPSPRHSTYGSAILAHLFRRRGDHIQNCFRKEEGRGVNALGRGSEVFCGGGHHRFCCERGDGFYGKGASNSGHESCV